MKTNQTGTQCSPDGNKCSSDGHKCSSDGHIEGALDTQQGTHPDAGRDVSMSQMLSFSFLKIIPWSSKIQSGMGWRKTGTSLRRRWPPHPLGRPSSSLLYRLGVPTARLVDRVRLGLSLLDAGPQGSGL